MSNIPKPNEIYKHFKGNLYKIITMAEDSETGADAVVYQALYGDFKVYVRELSSFMSKVDKNKYPNASQEYRFMLQTGVIARNETPKPQTNLEENEPVSEDKPVSESGPVSEGEPDPGLIEFLEADAYDEKLNILAGLRQRVTEDMINAMAASLDVEINEGSIEERYAQLKACLLTFEKYERSRLY